MQFAGAKKVELFLFLEKKLHRGFFIANIKNLNFRIAKNSKDTFFDQNEAFKWLYQLSLTH